MLLFLSLLNIDAAIRVLLVVVLTAFDAAILLLIRQNIHTDGSLTDKNKKQRKYKQIAKPARRQ